MSFSIPNGTDAELATEFRTRASQISAHAATLQDKQLQRGFLDIATTYQRMAEYIEKRFGVTTAIKASDAAQQAPAQDIAAAVDATPPDPKSETRN